MKGTTQFGGLVVTGLITATPDGTASKALCSLSRKAASRYFAFFFMKVVRTLKGCSLFVSLTAQKFVCSLPKMLLVLSMPIEFC